MYGIAAFARETCHAYACPGNHDVKAFRSDPEGYAAYVQGIRDCGIVWLDGASDIALDLPGSSFDIIFSGHFHGGQIWAPFDLEYRLLRRERLCKAGIRRGLHAVNGMRLYIGRGIGNVVFPFRFLSPPEITVIDLIPG